MVNTSQDFVVLVRDYLRETLGDSKNKVSVFALSDDRMNDELQTYKKKKRKGINMKIKFKCLVCKRSWASTYGNT